MPIQRGVAEKLKLKLSSCDFVITGYNNSVAKTIGKVTVHLKVDGVEAQVDALVVDDSALKTWRFSLSSSQLIAKNIVYWYAFWSISAI